MHTDTRWENIEINLGIVGLVDKMPRWYTNILHYGNDYECRSLKAKELWELFQNECDRRSILYKMEDVIKAYKQGYEDTQLSIFD